MIQPSHTPTPTNTPTNTHTHTHHHQPYLKTKPPNRLFVREKDRDNIGRTMFWQAILDGMLSIESCICSQNVVIWRGGGWLNILGMKTRLDGRVQYSIDTNSNIRMLMRRICCWCFETRFDPILCVAVCCSVLQCVAVCCSVLQCVAGRFDAILSRCIDSRSDASTLISASIFDAATLDSSMFNASTLNASTFGATCNAPSFDASTFDATLKASTLDASTF